MELVLEIRVALVTFSFNYAHQNSNFVKKEGKEEIGWKRRREEERKGAREK